MTKQAALQKEFDFIREAFFPRWDKERRWGVRYVHDLGGVGHCNLTIKMINVHESCQDMPSVLVSLVLIHEICHAVTRKRHGPMWAARMATVSRRALCAGRKVLCDEIRRDIASAMSDEPEEVDSLLHDWLDEHPEIQYGDLMRP